MTLFLDSSAVLKLYLDEDDSARYEELLHSDESWTFAQHACVEVRRILARRLESDDLADARRSFEQHWDRARIVELDESTCDLAIQIVETTSARTLDALHLAAAQRVGGGALSFVTADLRQAQVARSLGWTVLGT